MGAHLDGPGPTVEWCGIPVTRLWRRGNRGNVASVLIEKPARGDFLPILDGGYSLQYSPLMEHREGRGMVLFCQIDVTGRTESDPAAETLARNMLQYVSTWEPTPNRKAIYVGDRAGKRHLESAGIALNRYEGGNLSADQVLVVGAGGGKQLDGNATAIADFLNTGGHLLALGLDERDANAFLPFKVSMKKREHIASYFEPFGKDSLLAGVCPADAPPRLFPDDALAGQHGSVRVNAPSSALSQSRGRGPTREPVFGRPLPGPAGRVGRSVPIFPLVEVKLVRLNNSADQHILVRALLCTPSWPTILVLT